VVNGVKRTQCEVGEELATSWDATIGGKKFCRTLVLRRAPGA
jgi:hypothetical protein